MAESFTVTGLEELRRGVETLPASVTAALRLVALSTAQRVLASARANLATRTKGTGATARAMRIVEDAANKRMLVVSPGAPHVRFSLHVNRRTGRTWTQKVSANNLPIWLEYGTVTMPGGRPYMQPAADAARARYVEEMDAASIGVVQGAIG